MGAPRHPAQFATWHPDPAGVGADDGAAVGLPLLLRGSPPPSADAPLASQLEPLAVCTLLKPCESKRLAADDAEVSRAHLPGVQTLIIVML